MTQSVATGTGNPHRGTISGFTAVTPEMVAAGFSVTFSFDFKINNAAGWTGVAGDTNRVAFTLQDAEGDPGSTVVLQGSSAFWFVSGSQALARNETKPSTGSWYHVETKLDLNNKKYVTTISEYDSSGNPVALTSATNSAPQSSASAFSGTITSVRMFDTLNAQTIDAEFNDISVTYIPIPEPASLGLVGLGSLLAFSRKPHTPPAE